MYRVFRFLVSGGIAAVINLSLLYVFTDIFGIWYLLSATLSFIAAFLFNFTVQRFWVFENKTSDALHSQFVRFFVVAIFGVSLNALLMYIAVDYLGLWYMLAQVIITGILACINFFLYRSILRPGSSQQVSAANSAGQSLAR